MVSELHVIWNWKAILDFLLPDRENPKVCCQLFDVLIILHMFKIPIYRWLEQRVPEDAGSDVPHLAGKAATELIDAFCTAETKIGVALTEAVKPILHFFGVTVEPTDGCFDIKVIASLDLTLQSLVAHRMRILWTELNWEDIISDGDVPSHEVKESGGSNMSPVTLDRELLAIQRAQAKIWSACMLMSPSRCFLLGDVGKVLDYQPYVHVEVMGDKLNPGDKVISI